MARMNMMSGGLGDRDHDSRRDPRDDYEDRRRSHRSRRYEESDSEDDDMYGRYGRRSRYNDFEPPRGEYRRRRFGGLFGRY